MTNPNDPAFPEPKPTKSSMYRYCGLTKREAFAMAAMQGILSDYDSLNFLRDMREEGEDVPGKVAANAVLFADALIARINAKEGE